MSDFGSQSEAVPCADYYGATEEELGTRSAGRMLLGFLDQRRLFPHHGRLCMEAERLTLESWTDVPRRAVERIALEFTPAYTRFQAGGTRGKFPSLGALGNWGKPLLIRRTDGAPPLYLLLGFHWITGVTQNAAWHERLSRWLHEADT